MTSVGDEATAGRYEATLAAAKVAILHRGHEALTGDCSHAVGQSTAQRGDDQLRRLAAAVGVEGGAGERLEPLEILRRCRVLAGDLDDGLDDRDGAGWPGDCCRARLSLRRRPL